MFLDLQNDSIVSFRHTPLPTGGTIEEKAISVILGNLARKSLSSCDNVLEEIDILN